MDWNEVFDAKNMPTIENVQQYVREAEPRWLELTSYIEKAYNVKPKFEFSQCSMQPGWNVKYKKSGKSICTLYPMEGFFYCPNCCGTKRRGRSKTTYGNRYVH